MRKGWKPIEELGDVVMGLSPKGSTYNKIGIGTPLLNGPTEFGVHHPHCTLFTTDPKRICKKGDLIFCVRGSTTGKMNFADGEYALGRGVCSIRGENLLTTRFIKYAIDFLLFKLLSLTGGSTFPNLKAEDIKSFKVPYSKNILKIAKILSAYDDLIENNLKRIKLLEEMAQITYEEWFVRMRFPGHETAEWNEESGLPVGWERKKLGEVCTLEKDSIKSLEYGSKMPYIGLEHIPRKSMTLDSWE